VPAILLVDNDVDCRLIFRSALSYDGYQVIEAPDGDSAVQALAEHDIGVVLGELYIRCTAGELFLPSVKHLSRRENLSVVIVSTQGFDEARVDALAAGADEFLVKPCELSTVRATVRRLMGPPAPHSVARP
jgi:DNA-binding response OmpR family regulator